MAQGDWNRYVPEAVFGEICMRKRGYHSVRDTARNSPSSPHIRPVIGYHWLEKIYIRRNDIERVYGNSAVISDSLCF